MNQNIIVNYCFIDAFNCLSNFQKNIIFNDYFQPL